MTTTTTIDIGRLISKSPEVYHGRAVVSGTRVPVMSLAVLYEGGATAEEIARRKYLPLAQIYAALAYYHANKQEIENDLAEEEADYKRAYEEWQATHEEATL